MHLSQKQHLVGKRCAGKCSQIGLFRLQTKTIVLSLFLCTGGNKLIVLYLWEKSLKAKSRKWNLSCAKDRPGLDEVRSPQQARKERRQTRGWEEAMLGLNEALSQASIFCSVSLGKERNQERIWCSQHNTWNCKKCVLVEKSVPFCVMLRAVEVLRLM